MTEQFENKIRYDLTAEEYRKAPGISNSSLKWFRKSPAHYKAHLDGLLESEPSKAQKVGTLVHSLILESRIDYAVAPQTYVVTVKQCVQCLSVSDALKCKKCGIDRSEIKLVKPWNRNADFCAEWEAAQGKELVTHDEDYQIKRARDSVKSHPVAGPLFTQGFPEASLFARCPRSGFLLKARADYLKPRAIVDLKTAANADTQNFTRAIAKYQYAAQAAHYMYIARLLGLDVVDFYFVALELEPLPMPNVVLLKTSDLEIATEWLHRTLEELAECEAESHWPGYCDDEANVVELPANAFGLEEQTIDLNA